MQHPERLHLQAYFDQQVDALVAAGIEQHVEQCAQCRSALEDLRRIRSTLRENLTDHHASASLRARLELALERESGSQTTPRRRIARRSGWPSWQFWMGSLSGGGLVAACAALLAFTVWMPRPQPLVGDLVSAHVRSLMSTHPIDVISTDRHTVKPWFAGHADVSPVVADFETQGFRLVGGRADYLEHQRAAVMVYEHGAHTINVFSFAAGSRALPSSVTRDGYHVACWTAKDLDYCAVSDTGWDELHALQHLLQDLSDRDSP